MAKKVNPKLVNQNGAAVVAADGDDLTMAAAIVCWNVEPETISNKYYGFLIWTGILDSANIFRHTIAATSP
jgi:hypothetical protein